MARYIVVDFETYPVNGKSMIMEIGCCEIIDQQIGRTFQTLIKPIVPVTEFVLNLTGLNQAELDASPDFLSVVDEFHAFIGDSTIIAHNAHIDFNSYRVQCAHTDTQMMRAHWIDSQHIIQLLCPTVQTLQLQVLLEQFHCQQADSHRALSDARGLSHVLIQLCKKSVLYASQTDWHRFETCAIGSTQYLLNWLKQHVTIASPQKKPSTHRTILPTSTTNQDRTIQHVSDTILPILKTASTPYVVVTGSQTVHDYPYIPPLDRVFLPQYRDCIHCILTQTSLPTLEFVQLMALLNWHYQTNTYCVYELHTGIQQRFNLLSQSLFIARPSDYLAIFSHMIITFFSQSSVVECDATTFKFLVNKTDLFQSTDTIILHQFLQLDIALTSAADWEYSNKTVTTLGKQLYFMRCWIHYIELNGYSTKPMVKFFARIVTQFKEIEQDTQNIWPFLSSILRKHPTELVHYTTHQRLVDATIYTTSDWQQVLDSLNKTLNHLVKINHLFESIQQYIPSNLSRWAMGIQASFEHVSRSITMLTTQFQDRVIISASSKQKPTDLTISFHQLFQHAFFNNLQQKFHHLIIHQPTAPLPSTNSNLHDVFGSHVPTRHSTTNLHNISLCFYDSFLDHLSTHITNTRTCIVLPKKSMLHEWQHCVKKIGFNQNIHPSQFKFATFDQFMTRSDSFNTILIPFMPIDTDRHPFHKQRFQSGKIQSNDYISQLFLSRLLRLNSLHPNAQTIIVNVSPEYYDVASPILPVIVNKI